MQKESFKIGNFVNSFRVASFPCITSRLCRNARRLINYIATSNSRIQPHHNNRIPVPKSQQNTPTKTPGTAPVSSAKVDLPRSNMEVAKSPSGENLGCQWKEESKPSNRLGFLLEYCRHLNVCPPVQAKTRTKCYMET